MSDKETQIQIQQGFSKALLDCVEFEPDNCADLPATNAQAMANPKVQALVELLREYREKTPLGHQPHMIAHRVDAALAAFEADI